MRSSTFSFRKKTTRNTKLIFLRKIKYFSSRNICFVCRVAAKSKGKCTTFPYVTTICFVLFRVVSCSRPVSSVHGAPRPGRRVRRAWRVRLRLLRGPQRAAGPCSARCACTSQTERGEGGGSAVRLGVVLFPRRCLFRRCRIFRCSEFSG